MARTHPDEPERFQPEPDTLLLEDQSLRYGFVQLPKLVLYARNLSRDAKLLYAVLLGYAWQERRCFPGYSRLCDDMQASENAVRKYMRELEATDLLRQKRRGLGKTNIYTLLDLRTAKTEVQEPHTSEVRARTAKFAVQDSAKSAAFERRESAVADPANSADKIETEEIETERIRPSNVRKPSPKQNRKENDTIDVTHVDDEIREQLLHFVEDFAREFNDAAPLRSSTSRLANLYQRAESPMAEFIDQLYAARSITKERTAAIRTATEDTAPGSQKNKMGYFFAVLEDRLGLREPPDYGGSRGPKGVAESEGWSSPGTMSPSARRQA